MPDEPSLDVLIADHERGATAIACDLLAVLARIQDAASRRDAAERFLRERPAFAYAHRIAHIARTPEASDALAAERAHISAAPVAIAAYAAPRLPKGGTIATHSAGASVSETLRAAHAAGRAPRVLVGESRPRGEGRAFARDLARAGLDVTLVADAALPGLLDERSTVLLGADRLTECEAVCKIGGYALALAAHRAKRPTLVVADSHKVLPRSLAPVTSEEHDPNELGPAEPGVRTLNVYFESVPGRLLSRIITERGLWTRGELRRHALRAPRRLARR